MKLSFCNDKDFFLMKLLGWISTQKTILSVVLTTSILSWLFSLLLMFSLVVVSSFINFFEVDLLECKVIEISYVIKVVVIAPVVETIFQIVMVGLLFGLLRSELLACISFGCFFGCSHVFSGANYFQVIGLSFIFFLYSWIYLSCSNLSGIKKFFAIVISHALWNLLVEVLKYVPCIESF